MISSALRNNAPDETNSTTTPPPAPSTQTKESSSSTNPSPPFIHVEGVLNFRDLGGYPCKPPTSTTSSSSTTFDPQKFYIIRPHTLYRSAQPTSITPIGTEALTQNLKIRRFYDLRSEREIENSRQRQQFTAPTSKDKNDETTQRATPKTETDNTTDIEKIPVPVFRHEDYSPEGLVRKYANYTAPDSQPGQDHSTGFVKAYRDILSNGGPAFRKIFEHIKDRDIRDPDDGGDVRPEPLLFHCAAGKDRTGVFGGLVLRLCGVDDDIIVWEYGLTARGLGEWKEVVIKHLMNGGTHGAGVPPMTREQAERAVGSREGNMRVFLREVLDGEFGGVEKYMRDVCGFSGEEVETIRARLVVEGKSIFGDGEGYWKKNKEEPMGLAKGGDDDENGRKREQRVMTG